MHELLNSFKVQNVECMKNGGKILFTKLWLCWWGWWWSGTWMVGRSATMVKISNSRFLIFLYLSTLLSFIHTLRSIYPHFEILATPLLRPFSSQQDFHSCVIYRGLISHLNFWLFVACCCGMWRPQHFTRGSILKDGLHFLWRHYWQWGVVACPYQRRRLVCIVCIVWYWMGGLSLKTRLPADVTVTTALLWGAVACPYQRRRKRRKQKTPAFVGHPLNHSLPHPHPLPHPFVGHPLNHSSASSVFSFSKRPVTLPLGTQQMCICKRGYLVNCQSTVRFAFGSNKRTCNWPDQWQ